MSEQQALAEMRNAIKNTPNGEQTLARLEMDVDKTIATYSKLGDTGKMFLMFLAVSIAARADSDEL